MKTVLVVLLLGVVYVKEATQKATEETLKVSVYYDSLCSRSERFITELLYPAYQKIGSSLVVDLVPYGTTIKSHSRNPKVMFECPHGGHECVLNMFQACGLRRISNQTEQVEFVKCALDKVDNFRKFRNCATKVGLDKDEVLECALGFEGLWYFEKLSYKQQSLDPHLDHSPWIIIGEKYNKTLENQAFTNFLETACNLLDNKPPGCAKTDV